MYFIGIGVKKKKEEWGVMIKDERKLVWKEKMMIMWKGMEMFLRVMELKIMGEELSERIEKNIKEEKRN